MLIILSEKVKRIITSDYSERIFIVFVMINTIILSMEGLIQNELINLLLDYLNVFFAIMFILELVLKIFGLGFVEYS